MFGVNLLHALSGDVSINLRGGNIRMAQQQLHDAQIGAVVDEVGREGVAQRVRRERFVNAGDDCITFDRVPKRLPRHGRAARRDKQRMGHLA